MAEQRYSIGYALRPKKSRTIIRQSLVDLCESRGIDLHPIDLGRHLLNQERRDCILHKLDANPWEHQVEQFLAQNPNVLILDAPAAVMRLHDRATMLEVVSALPARESLRVPVQVAVYNREQLLNEHTFAALSFPLIAKPMTADGSPHSHRMALVHSRNGLERLQTPLVFLEFIRNYSEVVFKVYVAGSHVRVVKRSFMPPYLPDAVATQDPVIFSNADRCFDLNADDNNTPMPPHEFIVDLARDLRGALELNLFNFDLVRDPRNLNRYIILDMNYFPGYHKLDGYETMLTDFFSDIVNNAETGEANR